MEPEDLSYVNILRFYTPRASSRLVIISTSLRIPFVKQQHETVLFTEVIRSDFEWGANKVPMLKVTHVCLSRKILSSVDFESFSSKNELNGVSKVLVDRPTCTHLQSRRKWCLSMRLHCKARGWSEVCALPSRWVWGHSQVELSEENKETQIKI